VPLADSLLGIDNLLAEIILALGAALAIGMGMALFGPGLRERYGLPEPAPSTKAPPGTGTRLTGTARARAVFLLVVGLVMAGWGLASVLAK
jgi:hypothetical protein